MVRKYFTSSITLAGISYLLGTLLDGSASAKNCTLEEVNQYIQKFEIVSEYEAALKAATECNSSTVPLFIKALQTGTENVRLSSAYVLGVMTRETDIAVPALKEALLNDKKSSVRSFAASALGTIGESAESAIPSLIYSLKHSDSRTQSNSAFALGGIGVQGEIVVPELITKLNDQEENEVQANVAFALGEFGIESKQAIQPLLKTLEDDDQSVRKTAAQSLGKIAEALRDEAKKEDTVKALSEALSTVSEMKKALSKSEFEEVKQPVVRSQEYLKQALLIQGVTEWTKNGFNIWLVHAAFWLALIFAYPKFPQMQAIFFWNSKVRNVLGLGYVTFLLTWVPFLRCKLFEPFKPSLLADAGLNQFNPEAYFPDSEVSLKTSGSSQSITTAFPSIKGQVILEGDSGLGKTMFLRYLLKQSQRIAVYLPATKCSEGVIEAIQKKLHGDEIKDPKFLQSLIYSGAIDICIDGLNEVNPDTRAKITQFVESHFRGNILMTTQPLEWTPPATAKTYIMQPLQPDQIEHYLLSRQLPKTAPVQGTAYKQACHQFLGQMLGNQTSLAPEERQAAQTILSNPMELTIAAWMLADGKQPDLLNLRQQQYDQMAADYQRTWNREFPLKPFAEAVYQHWLTDQKSLPSDEFYNELIGMEDEKFRMVVSRQWQDAKGEAHKEWYFRHDKIAEFFIVQTFLGNSEAAENRLQSHIGDPRFRGVYFLLATLLPIDAAQQLREDLIDYAADTKDHTVSDTFVQLMRSRKQSP